MQKNFPLVTFILTCYNHSRFLNDSLEGFKKQNYPNVQLIINDACSTDNSIEVIKDWLIKNNIDATFVDHKKTLPVSQTVNAAVKLAKGKYISLCSGDDVWLENKILSQVKLLEELPDDYGIVYSECYIIDEKGNVSPNLFIKDLLKIENPPEGDIFNILALGNFLPALTLLIKRACYENVGLYDEQLCYEDWDLWLRIAQHFKIAYIPKSLAKYREVQGSLNHTLHEKRKYDIVATDCLIMHKSLKSKKIEKAVKEELINRLNHNAITLYNISFPNSYKYLLCLLRHKFTASIFYLFVKALFRVNPKKSN